MKKTLHQTDLTVCPICCGSGSFGTELKQAAVFGVLDRYCELGGNFIDTANNYGDWVPDAPRSASERVIGEWLKSRGHRSEIVLATKGGHPKFDSMHIGRLSATEILGDIERSLETLQTDYVDLYWLHVDDETKSVEEIMSALFEARDKGWVRYIGASNWKVSRLKLANGFAKSRSVTGFIADQTLWNAAVLQTKPYGSDLMGWMNAERYDYLLSTQMNAIPYQGQAFGLFHRMDNNTLDQMNPGFRGFYQPEEAARRFQAMREIMDRRNLLIGQVVLSYLISQPLTTTPIVGVKSVLQIEDCMKAVDVVLTAEEIEAIDLGHKGSELE
jgi:aryl-alcohol dehydrogenase-like predicted oxidoreductase